jgi:hypothetical protein
MRTHLIHALHAFANNGEAAFHSWLPDGVQHLVALDHKAMARQDGKPHHAHIIPM